MAERTGLEPATPGVTGRYSNQLNYRSAADATIMKLVYKNCFHNSPKQIGRKVAERTGLEPATPGVTGRYSNQLNYRSAAIYFLFLAAHSQGSVLIASTSTGHR